MGGDIKGMKKKKNENNTVSSHDVSEIKSCCKSKKKERGPKEYKSLINRLNRIEGQIRGIRKMVENDVYCTDILVQSAAVSAAINSFNRQLLEAHIKSCVVDDIRGGRDEVIDELLVILQKLMK